jgi:hypothetical protein
VGYISANAAGMLNTPARGNHRQYGPGGVDGADQRSASRENHSIKAVEWVSDNTQ